MIITNSALCASLVIYLTIILRNRAEYHLILTTNSHRLPFSEREKLWFYDENAKSWQHIMKIKTELQEIEVYLKRLIYKLMSGNNKTK